MIQEPNLTPEQKVNRMNFAYSVLLNQINSEIIGFSDESRFELDVHHVGCWHHKKRYNPLWVQHKEKYSPSLMIYEMFAKNFKSEIVFVENSMNQQFYKEKVINSNIVTTTFEKVGDQFISQQDGASCYTTPKNYSRKKTLKFRKRP